MPAPPFLHIDCWVFDLDNTLYPARANLFGQIDQKMGAYIQDLLNVDQGEARRVQKHFFHTHGTTLRGLMNEYAIDPHHFLDFVHDIDVSVLCPAPNLADALSALPGRKLVFTNADRGYAERVMQRLGIDGVFDGMFDIIDAGFAPKPDPAPYQHLLERFAIDPHAAVFVEDMARNLAPAKALGMTTVWVDCASERGSDSANDGHVDHVITDVGDWLTTLTAPSRETSLTSAVGPA
jgi:putative hydrolase of the HAD superfamily